MAYEKQDFEDKQTLTAEMMGKMEDGILVAQDTADEAWAAAKNMADPVPDYVRAEAERVAKLVQSRQGANTVTFLACSDIHHSTVNNAEQMAETLTHLGQGMELAREKVSIDFAACLGDSIWDGSNETVENVQEAMREVNAALFPAFSGIPNFRLVGNHEVHYNGTEQLTASQIFANTAAFNAGAVFGDDRSGGYCYRDFEGMKLRVVCLNTSESDESGSFVVSSTQLEWLAETLDLSSLGSGWRSIILSHIPLDWYGGGTSLLNVVSAADGVICNIHGHIHNYLAGTLTGTSIPRFAIPNGCFYRANEYGQNGTTEYNGMEFGEKTTYDKTAGTAEDTAFCVVTIDFDNEVIYADHYGAGYDREVSFVGEVSTVYTVTYNLTKVTAELSTTEVSDSGSYVNSLTAASGYELSSVIVTMGGVDVTSAYYSDGLISIDAVTGNIVITATATIAGGGETSYTNLVPTALAFDGSGSVFDSVGYMNGVYLSTASPYYNTDASTVTVGLIPWHNHALDPTSHVFTPPTIYVKGATIDTSNSHVRMGYGQGAKKYPISTVNASRWSEAFNVVTLGDQYYKLEPLFDDSGQNQAFAAWSWTYAEYIAFSFAGTGENLIITLDEPIE